MIWLTRHHNREFPQFALNPAYLISVEPLPEGCRLHINGMVTTDVTESMSEVLRLINESKGA